MFKSTPRISDIDVNKLVQRIREARKKVKEAFRKTNKIMKRKAGMNI